MFYRTADATQYFLLSESGINVWITMDRSTVAFAVTSRSFTIEENLLMIREEEFKAAVNRASEHQAYLAHEVNQAIQLNRQGKTKL